MSVFSENLRTLRGDESQASFSKQIGLHVIQYSKYERGVNNPSIEVLEKICRVHSCSADWLLGLSDGNERGTSVHAPNNSGAIAVGKNARATSGGTHGVRPLPDCANCKYKRLADAFKAL